jgi:hypothetical protein
MDLEILIEIVKSLPGALIAGALAYYFSQKRYTFEKLHDRKLSYLEEIFGKIISLEKDLKKYVLTTGSMMQAKYLEDRKKELKPIQDKFFELQEYFWAKEIVLDQSSIEALQNFIDVSIEILSKLQVSNMSLSNGDHEVSSNLWDESYKKMQTKLVLAKQELRKDFKKIIKGRL